jgi:hypothetical protein
MPIIQTHEIIAEALTPRVTHTIAHAFGVHEQTARAWGRAPETDDTPTGTGKSNPLDRAARLIRLLHRYAPGAARLAAQYFQELTDELDEAAGEGASPASPLRPWREALSQVVREVSDVELGVLQRPDTRAELKELDREIAEAICALAALQGDVRRHLERRGQGLGIEEE